MFVLLNRLIELIHSTITPSPSIRLDPVSTPAGAAAAAPQGPATLAERQAAVERRWREWEQASRVAAGLPPESPPERMRRRPERQEHTVKNTTIRVRPSNGTIKRHGAVVSPIVSDNH